MALAKWLSTQARIFLLDEPTVGIDVGAKVEIYQLMAALAREGVACLLVSSDIPEILSMSSRVVVMRKGRISGELDPRRQPRRTCCVSPCNRLGSIPGQKTCRAHQGRGCSCGGGREGSEKSECRG